MHHMYKIQNTTILRPTSIQSLCHLFVIYAIVCCVINKYILYTSSEMIAKYSLRELRTVSQHIGHLYLGWIAWKVDWSYKSL